ncbi:MAG: hypothetical protein ABSC56_02445 [Solirubrobacteraceae bacterium]|jgi:TRAP-type C4-dicarboxylate transport system permease small subunit
MQTARNVAILMLIALVIVVVPGGAQATNIVYAVLSLVFAALIAYFVGRLYRDRRIEIYSLGELDRGILYASIAGIVVLLAGAQWWRTTAGTVVELALLALCAAGLVRVYQVWRSY